MWIAKLMFATVLSASLIMAACGTESSTPPTGSGSTSQPVSGGTLRVGTTADNKTIDPALLTTNPDVWTVDQVYDKLVERGYDMKVKPRLAQSWQPNSELTSYTFTLRQGVKFHGGQDFAADDVVYSFKRYLNPDVGSPAASVLSTVTEIEAVGTHTVRFDLASPSAFFPDLLTAYQLKVLDSRVDTTKLGTQANGTGPFTLQEYKPGERAVLKRNANFWGEGPYLDEVVFFYMPSNQARYEALKTGAVDAIYPLAVTAVADLERSAGVTISRISSSSYLNFVLDNTQAPFDNPKVRQAVQAATNREEINKAAVLGLGTIAADISIAPNDPNFPMGVTPVPYDPARAKQLLAEAGHPNGIELTLHTADVFPGLVESAIALQASAAPAGIRIQIQRDPEEIYWDKIWLHEAFTTLAWFGRDADSSLSINALSEGAWNEAKHDDKRIDALIIKARGQTDLAARRETYKELQGLLAENAGRIITVFTPILMGLRSNIDGLSAHPTNFLLLEGAVKK